MTRLSNGEDGFVVAFRREPNFAGAMLSRARLTSAYKAIYRGTAKQNG